MDGPNFQSNRENDCFKKRLLEVKRGKNRNNKA